MDFFDDRDDWGMAWGDSDGEASDDGETGAASVITQENYEADGGAFSTCPLPELAGQVEFREIRMLPDTKQVELALTDDPRAADISTVLGGRRGDRLRLNRKQVMMLPHDMVHAMLHALPEQPWTEMAGKSPDIVWRREDGKLDVIEVTTSRYDSDAVLESAIQEKLNKYGIFIGRMITRFNVVVVSPHRVKDLGGEITGEMAEKLCAAYRLGLRVVAMYEAAFGRERRSRVEPEAMKTLGEFLRGLEVPDNLFGRFGPSPGLTQFNYGETTYVKPVWETFDEYVRKRSGRGELRIRESMIHVPMVVVEPRASGRIPSVRNLPSASLMPSAYQQILASASVISDLTDVNLESKLEELELISELRGGRKRDLKEEERTGDRFGVQLSPAEQRVLAMRGVGAKGFRQDEDFQDVIAGKKLPIDFDSVYDDAASFLERPVRRDAVRDVGAEYVRWCCDATPRALDSARVFEQVLQTDELLACAFLEAVHLEIVANCKRRTKVGDVTEFILRRVQGYEAYVAIHYTNTFNLEQHIFYSVIGRGRALCEGVFEALMDAGDGWFMTQFVSTNLRKAEHYQNLSCKMASLWALAVEEFGPTLGPETPVAAFDGVGSVMRFELMMTIDNNSNAAIIASTMRYYYARLLAGGRGALDECQKVTSKWPEVLHNHFSVFLIQRIQHAHALAPEIRTGVVDVEDGGLDDRASVDTADIQQGDPLESDVFTDPVPTFIGFSASKPAQLLSLSYFHVLRNKNEGNWIQSATKVMEKMFKTAYAYKAAQPAPTEASHRREGTNVDPSSIPVFSFSPAAIATGVVLMKKQICDSNGWRLDEYNDRVTDLCLVYLLEQTLDMLSTTKTTTVPYDIDVRVHVGDELDEEEDETLRLGRRMKLFLAVHGIIDEMHDHRIAADARTWQTRYQETENGRVQATFFRKPQNTGQREIYVLSLNSRVWIKMYSDVHRRIAMLHPAEKLTDDTSKDGFLRDHLSASARKAGRWSATISVSGDMTTWSQLFTMFEFREMDRNLLPPTFQALSEKVLSAHRLKTVQLSPEIIGAFVRAGRRPDATPLSSSSVDRVRAEFLGKTAPEVLRSSFSPVAEFANDMFQGILHYPSSNYHVAAASLLKQTLEIWISRQPDLAGVISFEVSSDDEAYAITLCSENKAMLRRAALRLKTEFPHIKAAVDGYFNVQTSDLKTVVGLLRYLEFNSIFNIDGTVVVPLIKWVAVACEDNPASTLHKRVSSMSSQLRSVREMGGTGYLCQFIQMAQASALARGLGHRSTSWGTTDVFKDVHELRLSYSGFLLINDPMTSGITDVSYANWKTRADPRALRVIAHLGPFVSEDDEEIMMKVSFGVFPMTKYHKILDAANLTGARREHTVTEDNFQGHMFGARNLQDVRSIIERQMLDPSIAASLTFTTRSVAIAQTVYLLYGAFYDAGDGRRVPLRRLLATLADRPTDMGLDVLFPMSRSFDSIAGIESQTVVFQPRLTRLRTRTAWLSPSESPQHWESGLSEALGMVWFGRAPLRGQGTVESDWSHAKRNIGFLRDTLPETFDASPFRTLNDLLVYLTGFKKVSRPRRFYVRGRTSRVEHPTLSLIVNNLTAAGRCSLASYDVELPVSGEGRRVDYMLAADCRSLLDRVAAYYQLVEQQALSHQAETIDRLLTDVRSQTRRMDLLGRMRRGGTGRNDLDDSLWRLLLLSGEIDLEVFAAEAISFTIYHQMQVLGEDGRYTGDLDKVQKRGGVFFQTRVTGQMTQLISPVSAERTMQLSGRTPHTEFVLRPVGAPTGTFDRPVREAGAWYMRCYDDVEGQTWYLGLPRAFTGGDPQTSDAETVIDCWLERRDLPEAAISEFLDNLQSQTWLGSVCRATIYASKRVHTRARVVQLRERARPEPVIEDLEAFTMQVMSALKPTEQDDEDLLDFQIYDNTDWNIETMNTDPYKHHVEEDKVEYDRANGFTRAMYTAIVRAGGAKSVRAISEFDQKILRVWNTPRA